MLTSMAGTPGAWLCTHVASAAHAAVRPPASHAARRHVPRQDMRVGHFDGARGPARRGRRADTSLPAVVTLHPFPSGTHLRTVAGPGEDLAARHQGVKPPRSG